MSVQLNKSSREQVIELLSDDEWGVEQLAHHIEVMLESRGRRDARNAIDFALNHPNGGPAEAAKQAAKMLERGADDRWSGRQNDTKRAYHDGVRKYAGQWLVDYLRDNAR